MVRAYDEGRRFDEARVNVVIRRDELPPYFVNAPYTFSFEDSRAAGDMVYTGVLARDTDGSVSA